MSTLAAFVRRHPVAVYFSLAFAISWGGVLAVVGPEGIPGTPAQTEALFPSVYLAMLAGPSLAGLLLTGLVHGRAGFRDLRSRLLRWRVGARWYAVALLTAPVVIAATLLALSLMSREFPPAILTADNKTSLLLFGLAVGLGAGVFEELGWTGLAIPELSRRHGNLAIGLIVGVLWAAWHLLVNVWGGAGSWGTLPPALFLLVSLLSFLPPYRVLMVWVYHRTQSLLVAMLMHVSLTASVLILGPVISGGAALTYNAVLAAALWAIIAIVALAHSGRHSQLPLRKEAA